LIVPLHLDLAGRQPSQARVYPSGIVERLDVGEQFGSGRLAARVDPTLNLLGLDRAEERFHRGVVVWVAFPAHARLNVVVAKPVPVFVTGILAAATTKPFFQ